MRGKRQKEIARAVHGGITPADAGKTSVARRIQCRLQDHPRGCGENRTRNRVRFFFPGSPPRMRGKHGILAVLNETSGITPADAGKTGYERLEAGSAGDHPRGCGENSTTCDKLTFPAGSPPRMRGKRLAFLWTNHGLRITPADAGKTYRPKTNTNERRDHPRGCGENQSRLNGWRESVGSPPRMRGKHLGHDCNQAERGITPADAGKTHRGIMDKKFK